MMIRQEGNYLVISIDLNTLTNLAMLLIYVALFYLIVEVIPNILYTLQREIKI